MAFSHPLVVFSLFFFALARFVHMSLMEERLRVYEAHKLELRVKSLPNYGA